MTRCPKCDKRIMIGGIKACEGIYCTPKCAQEHFQPRFLGALALAVEKTPDPFPSPAPPPKPKPEVADWEGDDAPGFSNAFKDIDIIAIGLAVMVFVVVLIHEIHQLVHYPFYAQSFLIVIPIGAMLCGCVAGGGFWFSLRKFERLPTSLTYLAAGLGGAIGFVLIYFLMWMNLQDQGIKVRDEIGFVDFLKMMVENQAVKVGRGGGKSIELGKMGYFAFAMNVLGFAAGVVSMVSMAGGQAYCARCKRYFKVVGTQTRSSNDPESAGALLHPVIVGICSGRLQEAIDLHAESGQADGKAFWITKIELEACPGCGLHQATLTASSMGERGPELVPDFKYQGSVHQHVVLSP